MPLPIGLDTFGTLEVLRIGSQDQLTTVAGRFGKVGLDVVWTTGGGAGRIEMGSGPADCRPWGRSKSGSPSSL